MDKVVAVPAQDPDRPRAAQAHPQTELHAATADPTREEVELAAAGFAPFARLDSKGHAFAVWLKARPGRRSWKTAVLSRGLVAHATAYVTDGVLRASVPIGDPRGHLLFRADMVQGLPSAGDGLRSKFGAL